MKEAGMWRRVTNVVSRASALIVMGLLAPGPDSAAGTLCTNPGGDCNSVLIVPVKYAPEFCPGTTPPSPVGACSGADAACCADIDCPEGNTCDFIFKDPPRLSATAVRDLFANLVNDNFAAWSFNTWLFSFEVLQDPNSSDGWWTLPATFSDYVDARKSGADIWVKGDGARALVQDAIEDVAANANRAGIGPPVHAFNHLVVVLNEHVRRGQTLPSVSYEVPVAYGGGFVDVVHAFGASAGGVGVTDAGIASLMSHELLHQLGLGDFYGTCLITETPLAAFEDECNGPWDIMAYDDPSKHPTAYNKRKLGWLPDDTTRVRTLPVPTVSLSETDVVGPLEELASPGLRLLRIPFAQPLPDAPFEGLYVECRARALGDEALPEPGVLIQEVKEAKPGVALNDYIPARVIRADAPFTLESSAITTDQVWFDQARGITISMLGTTGSVDAPSCIVRVDYAASAGNPDPAFYSIGESSPDLWMDSVVGGGYGVYPNGQPVDGDGVPIGQGDPFYVGPDNVVRLRVRNLGTATQPPLLVRVTAQQPPHATCGGLGPTILNALVPVSAIEPGGVAFGEVALPDLNDSSGILVRAHIEVPADASFANNSAQRVFYSAKGSSSLVVGGVPQPVTSLYKVLNLCTLRRAISVATREIPFILPGPDPRDVWQIRHRQLFDLAVDESRDVLVTVAPARSTPVGTSVVIPLSFATSGGLRARGRLQDRRDEIEAIPLLINVVDPAFVTLDVGAGLHALGATIPISGRLTPTADGSMLSVRYVAPSGTVLFRSATTDGAGRWSDDFSPGEGGRWTVEALWPGDARRSEAQSPPKTFDVFQPVVVDVRPGSCPNNLNPKARGVLPVAIVGTNDFDVAQIDPASIRLEGVPPIRSSIDNLTAATAPAACECGTEWRDGIADWNLKFAVPDLVQVVGPLTPGADLVVTLTGLTTTGVQVRGEDCVTVPPNR